MKFSTAFGLLATLAATVIAEDVLFVETFQSGNNEYTEATTALGLTAKVVTEAEWRTMKTADFAAFKSIVLADPFCSRDATILDFLEETKNVWGPAVQGNIVLIGTDPSWHFADRAGAKVLIDNSIAFSAAGVSLSGASQTGLYFSLSCYYHSVESSSVPALSYFGDFQVRGNLDCYNKVHKVASSPALGTLDDVALSNWACSVHEAFSVYPSIGINGFQALAIAQDIIGVGSQTFGDGTVGLPYIISRGATPAACGNGKWESEFGEECDDNNTVNGDGCSASCKCESGRPAGDGSCLPPLAGNGTGPYVPSGKPVPYGNGTVTATVISTSTFCPGPYHTPTVPTVHIIGVEIIIFITIVESCTTIDGTAVTSYLTSTGSTLSKPIYNTDKPGYPCYVCALSSVGIAIPTDAFITASTTSCALPPATYTPLPPVITPCSSCAPYTPSTCPVYTVPASATEILVAAPIVTGSHSLASTYAPTTVVTAAGSKLPPVPTTTAKALEFEGKAGLVVSGLRGVGVVAGMVAGLVVF